MSAAASSGRLRPLRLGMTLAMHSLRLGIRFAMLSVWTGIAAAGTPPFEGAYSSTPLAPRAAAEYPTLFEALPAEGTGIDFASHWNPSKAFEAEIATSGFASGVALGDYDGDGRIDVFLTRPFGGSRLYRNLGEFRFEDVTERAGVRDDGAWGRGASFADIDGDGDLDLFLCRLDQPNSLYLNQGDGRFVERGAEFGIDYRGASVMIAFADYDRDGDLDAYLVTNRIHPPSAGMDPGLGDNPSRRGEPDKLYRNEGGVGFVDVSREAGIGKPNYGLSATWWDYDADGYPDLYVASDFTDPDQLFHNQGDGSFRDRAAEVLPHTPWYSMGSDAGDIDNDGRIDFFASDMSATSHYRQKLAMGDMDEASLLSVRRGSVQLMRNALYLNTGTHRFMEVAYLAGLADSDWTWSVLLEDLDEDGRIDLFASNGMTRDYMNSDLRKQASEFAEQSAEFRAVYLESEPLAQRNLAFRNLGELAFESSESAWGIDHVGISSGAALADLDSDGDLDLVVQNFDEAVSVYRNQSTAGHRISVRLSGAGSGTGSNRDGIGARVTLRSDSGLQTRQVGLARGFLSATAPQLHFGLGEDPRIHEMTIHWPSGQVQRLENLAADQSYQIREPEPPGPAALAANGAATPSRVSAPTPARRPSSFVRSKHLRGIEHRETPIDDFACQPLLPNKLSQLGPGLAWGDVDGDGDDDLYVGAAAGEFGGLIYLDRGEQGFVRSRPRAFSDDHAYEDLAPLFLDVDTDGDLDLYVVSGGGGCDPDSELLRDRLYLNDGRGNFTRAAEDALPDARNSGSSAVAGDFDRDGDLDLFVGSRAIPGLYPKAPESRLLLNQGGSFRDVTDELAPALRRSGLVTSALWSDADGDGWLDLLVTHEWGPVKLYGNRKGRGFEDLSEAAGLARHKGWWNGIAGRDLDHDGDIDYVVSNFGLNSKYHASAEEPALSFLGAFGDGGEMRVLEAEYEGGELLPGRGRSCSTRAIPSLAENFGSFRDFARASLPEIYELRGLPEAERFEATTLESGSFLNQGDGSFRFVPLPRLAQASPGFGLVLTEFDGDGNPDLYLAQNFFGPQVETGPMDGGLSMLLRGRGDGSFEAVGPERSGLVVPEDAMSVTTADLDDDGHPDLVIGVNDGELLAFENHWNTDQSLLPIRLRGPAGNPSGVGARVTVHMEGGSSQTAEVYAGGGYLSQSAPTLYFGTGNAATREVRIEVRWPDGALREYRSSSEAGAPIVLDRDSQP